MTGYIAPAGVAVGDNVLDGDKPQQNGSYVQWFGKEFFGTFSIDGNCNSISANLPNVIGHDVAKCLGPGFANLIRKIDIRKFKKMLSNQDSQRKLRLRIRHVAGHWEWLEVSTVTRLDSGDIGVIFHKITDEVAKENALQRATAEAELALRGQSEFFAHISHELRTPLNAILGFTQMMHQGMFGEIANPRYRDYIQFLEQSGKELLDKIDDLLEISSLCAGIDKLNERNVILLDIVREVVNIHARELFARHIHVDIDIENIILVADKIKIQQALSHIIRNAVKFSPEHTVISIYSERKNDGSISLVVTDEGKGFSSEQIEYFVNSDKNLAFLERNRKLMGFGLPLAEELIRLHNGKLTCRNHKDKGAEITITLPAKRIIAIKNDQYSSVTQPSEAENID